jgi:hypothetical protein
MAIDERTLGIFCRVNLREGGQLQSRRGGPSQKGRFNV